MHHTHKYIVNEKKRWERQTDRQVCICTNNRNSRACFQKLLQATAQSNQQSGMHSKKRGQAKIRTDESLLLTTWNKR